MNAKTLGKDAMHFQNKEMYVCYCYRNVYLSPRKYVTTQNFDCPLSTPRFKILAKEMNGKDMVSVKTMYIPYMYNEVSCKFELWFVWK